ncbi:3-phosphoshikimate 1-carboxyvinyltransferase [Tunicatimonas pelagia]|uniref:3-phosphoshikimate 1-carboxyvinyltransferase n=1 Tax=Tunicatimonas pelagia TaxID=931531 RepID=UPI002665DF17|nr:3-phosphoshikimate 1-carboxyvinyltransferase [Tunicatimonas pelagia]WKN41034.1 3-phosphoshikimate 1-carboxyvinyltransferase [Tunicatimonas pelagia]
MQYLHIHKPNSSVRTTVQLPASKSESNRALIIQALSEKEITLHNLSEARDTQTMQRLLQSNEPELDVLDAGTTMRFLIAYCTVKKLGKIIKGTPRMHQRPVRILVDALREIGADIQYLQEEGYPPVHVRGMTLDQSMKHVRMRGDVSSQYISALLMIAPTFNHGLLLELIGKVGSRPYISMTLSLMQHFGVSSIWENKQAIRIEPASYLSGSYIIESDWSGASYWYSFIALAEHGEVLLKGLRKNSFQGDQAIVEIMENLGVQSAFESEGVRLVKQNNARDFSYDFSDCPDLAQTVAVVCAAKGVHCTMTGLESLRIKETDRIAALQTELAKIGAKLDERGSSWKLIPSQEVVWPNELVIDTYDDHRMAMAFAPLVMKSALTIENPDVVNKSYPRFWEDLQRAGVETIQSA